jgi:hypothetical protein
MAVPVIPSLPSVLLSAFDGGPQGMVLRRLPHLLVLGGRHDAGQTGALAVGGSGGGVAEIPQFDFL